MTDAIEKLNHSTEMKNIKKKLTRKKDSYEKLEISK
jgi:hypothetical protein